ncbi:MAG: menaquinone biosynthesis protein [Planctomycetaceae bacterium]|nr:menaquinone biosynthesis protein [Planctomycetaceae bacterium]
MIDTNRGGHMDWTGSRTRIGAVRYLNSKPLLEGLADHCPDSDLILDLPSRLADDLARGNLDVALIPSVEAFADPDYEVVSDACVATHGPVLSVKLYSRVHPGEIRSLALDEGSRTSAALVQVMLFERYGVRPKLEKLPIGRSAESTTTDAVLLIGDRAMFSPQEEFETVWDLGEEWVEWTGLPFVFAMWVTRRDTELGNLESKLNAARNCGLERIETIARSGATHLGLEYEEALRYLTKNLHFRLGAAEKMGLRLFQDLAASIGLCAGQPLVFRSESNANSRAQKVPEFTSVDG